MNKNDVNVIKEVIEDTIKIRDDLFYKSVINREDLNFYKEIHSLNDKDFDYSNEYNKLGITKEDLEEVEQSMRPDDENLQEMEENNLHIFKNTHKDLWLKFETDFDKSLIKLNSLLNDTDKYEEILKIEEIQSKKFLTVKELEKIYNISSSSQKNYRGRLNDPLPYHQKVQGGKIIYDNQEVLNWLENQYK